MSGIVSDPSARAKTRWVRAVASPRTLVWIGNGVSVSYDACGSFRAWYPTALPAELIEPIDKPAYCTAQDGRDCRHLDFIGERAPQFEDIRVGLDGTISFVLRSKALRRAGGLRIRSADRGLTWTVHAP